MRAEVLPPGALALMDRLAAGPAATLRGWTLAGGTGLALYLGHRDSDDLDFFRTDEIRIPRLLATLRAHGEREPMPRMRIPFSWDECRRFFEEEARRAVLGE